MPPLPLRLTSMPVSLPSSLLISRVCFSWRLVPASSVLSATPVLQLLSFGYLLESGGRVARSGRLCDAFIGVRRAARLGSIIIGCTLVYLPLRLVASWAASAPPESTRAPSPSRWTARCSAG